MLTPHELGEVQIGLPVIRHVTRGASIPLARYRLVAGSPRTAPKVSRVIAPSWDSVRLFLHVLAATIWVGGQLTLAALVPALRAAGADVPRTTARAFNRVAWPAYGGLIVTGMWNIAAVRSDDHGSYRTTLIVKLVVVAASGLTAWLHARSTSKVGLAAWGALTALTAFGALFLGILLTG